MLFQKCQFLNGIFNFRLIWNLTVKSRWEAPGRLDAEAGATGGLGTEGRGRGVEQTRGTGGSPCLLSGSSAGSGGTSGPEYKRATRQPGLHHVFLPELMEFLELLARPPWTDEGTVSMERTLRKPWQLANIICQLVAARDPRCLFLQCLNGIICDAPGGMKRRHWQLVSASTGPLCSFPMLRSMIKEFSAVWVVADVLHAKSGVVFSFDNLNWVLWRAYLFKGNVTTSNSRAVAMLTGNLTLLHEEDCEVEDEHAFRPIGTMGRSRPKHVRMYMNAKRQDGNVGK